MKKKIKDMNITEAEIIDLELHIEDALLCEEIFYKDDLERL